jgi:hypothetical protein
MFALIYFLVWTILGHIMIQKEPKNSPCVIENDGFLINVLNFNLIAMDVFLILGSLIFLFSLCVAACDEGRYTYIYVFLFLLIYIYLKKIKLYYV